MGLSHPAINTRDTALFMSFRRTLGHKPTTMIPLETLVKHFMGRDIGQSGDIPVSVTAGLGDYCALWDSRRLEQVERARAALDLFRSCEQTWEGIIATGAWPCALPPTEYRRCFT